VQDGDTVRVNNVTSSTHHISSPTQVSDDKPLSRPKRKKSLRLHNLFPKPEKATPLSSAVPEPKSKTSSHKHMDAYETLRKKNIMVVRHMSAAAIICVAKEATSARRADVMDHLTTDVVENFHDLKGGRLIVPSIVELHVEDCLISYARLHPLLLLLQSSESTFSLLSLVRLTKLLIKQLSDDPSSDTSLPMVLALLDKSLMQFAPAATGAAAVSYRPPDIVKLSFILIERLIHARRDKDALDVFQVLVSRNNIPPEAIRDTDYTTPDSGFIILSTLVRSCLHWGWRRLSIDLCRVVLRKEMVVPPQVIDLTVDVLYSILEGPAVIDIQQFCYLARELGTSALDFELPHNLLRLYYKFACTLNQGPSAELLYEHTQSFPIVSRHTYPPPEGDALVWLLHHLAVNNKNLYLARRLVEYVVEHYEPIPPQARAQFIALTATCGFASLSRELWERYTAGLDRDMVGGNAATMLRLVSVYMSTTRKTQLQLAQTMDKEQKEGTTEDTQSMREMYEDRSKDISAFIHSVVAEYRRTQEPLAKAPHFPLTSLARAYFMLGNVAAGFEMFRVLLDRKEMPDLYDINVALSAMAEYTPRGAAQMITRMIDKGVRPDAITFGTVLHFAAIHKDTELVGSLIKQARLIDNGELTLKSVQALIRASIGMEDDPELLGANLARALEIIQTLTRSKLVCSPRTGMYCIKSALKVSSPVLAFKFWQLLVERKLEWTDTQHVMLRRLIAQQIDRHYEAGLLTEERTKVMHFLMRREPEKSIR
jgi:hypothetical protein